MVEWPSCMLQLLQVRLQCATGRQYGCIFNTNEYLTLLMHRAAHDGWLAAQTPPAIP